VVSDVSKDVTWILDGDFIRRLQVVIGPFSADGQQVIHTRAFDKISCQNYLQPWCREHLHEIGKNYDARIKISNEVSLVNYIYYESYLVHLKLIICRIYFTFKFTELHDVKLQLLGDPRMLDTDS
jgi:hypothetical protein